MAILAQWFLWGFSKIPPDFSFLILKRARPFNFSSHKVICINYGCEWPLGGREKWRIVYIEFTDNLSYDEFCIYNHPENSLQYDRKNQKSDQFTDRQAYAGTSNNDKIAWTFCSGELNRWFIVHAIFRENTIENQILCIVRFEVYALSPLNLDVKCVQVNDLFILQGDIVFI